MKTFRAEATAAPAARLGEGPVWHQDALWYVDIMAGRIIRFDPADDTATEWGHGHPTACLTPCGDGFIVGTDRGFARVRPGETAEPFPPLLNDPAMRMNDGATDRQGRVIAASMDRDGARAGLHLAGGGTLLTGLRTGNGLAFSPDGRTIYWSDSHPDVQTVWRAAYDPDTGTMGEGHVFHDFAGGPGRPDGAAVDAGGGYWIAAIDSGRVVRLDAEGRIDAVVEVPVAKPTKPVFGGDDLRTMFITTIDAGEGGQVFSVRLPYAGLPAVSASLDHLQ